MGSGASGASAAGMGPIEEPESSVTVLSSLKWSLPPLALHGSYRRLVGFFPAGVYILSESIFCAVEPQGIRLFVHCYLLMVDSPTSIQKICDKNGDTKLFKQLS